MTRRLGPSVRAQRIAAEKEAQRYKIETNTAYLLDLGADLGFGAGVREYQFAKVLKRKFAADLYWPAVNLLVELEGGVYSRGSHVRPGRYTQDCEKYSIASILGYRLIRLTYEMVDNGKAIELSE